MSTIDIRVPELDMGDTTVSLSAWLVKVGAEVLPGERILELTAGEAVIQISSPVSGLIAKRCVAENDDVRLGDLLAVISTQ